MAWRRSVRRRCVVVKSSSSSSWRSWLVGGCVRWWVVVVSRRIWSSCWLSFVGRIVVVRGWSAWRGVVAWRSSRSVVASWRGVVALVERCVVRWSRRRRRLVALVLLSVWHRRWLVWLVGYVARRRGVAAWRGLAGLVSWRGLVRRSIAWRSRVASLVA
ncbi:hypothetical protein ACXZ9C_10655 [Streptococcus agalactiae]